MARPKVENAEIRESLLQAAEHRLRRQGSPRFSVTDLAADCRMSQSNVYRFFPNKAALMAGLAERWF
ncbi:MAG: TetR/AcrR family transcriptional regulator, partial [Pseudomonadota bacterium]|nr:TetR/AcrR family transcriptional regulator [Pseudomonadota bacterium]